MVAGAEPEELDDLSEEGRQNLLNYVAWQDAREKSLRHSDIMDRFGHEGAGVRAFGLASIESYDGHDHNLESVLFVDILSLSSF